jgi:hypothetical protein
MKTRLCFALPFLVTFGLGLGQGQSNEEPNNGFWWVNQSETFKLGFQRIRFSDGPCGRQHHPSRASRTRMVE